MFRYPKVWESLKEPSICSPNLLHPRIPSILLTARMESISSSNLLLQRGSLHLYLELQKHNFLVSLVGACLSFLGWELFLGHIWKHTTQHLAMSWVKYSLHQSVPAILEDFSLTTKVRKHAWTKRLGTEKASGWLILDSHIIRFSCHHHHLRHHSFMSPPSWMSTLYWSFCKHPPKPSTYIISFHLHVTFLGGWGNWGITWVSCDQMAQMESDLRSNSV